MEKEQQKTSESNLNEQVESAKPSTKNSSTTTKKPRKTTSKKAVGLGDVVEKVTEATGIKSLVKGLTDDCGCDARKDKLNRMFRFYEPLTEEQKKVWEGVRHRFEDNVVTATEQNIINGLYNEVFKARAKFSRCSPCVVRRMRALEDVYQLCVS